MRKEMPVILVIRVVDPKRIIRKKEGRGGVAQGVADPKKIDDPLGENSPNLVTLDPSHRRTNDAV
jgi:hypothetical protein